MIRASFRRVLATFAMLTSVSTLSGERAFAMTLDEAKASEFFTWFHLTEGPDGGSPVHTFRPEADQFRALVAVSLTTGPDGHVTASQLTVARAFIADPRQSSFARDITKSFLGFAAGNQTAPALTALIEEIQFRDLSGQIFMRGDPPKLPAEPSAPYRAFAGDRPEATLDAAKTRFIFRKGTSQGAAVLTIVATPEP